MPLVGSQSSFLASGTRIFTGAARRQHTPWRHSETGWLVTRHAVSLCGTISFMLRHASCPCLV